MERIFKLVTILYTALIIYLAVIPSTSQVPSNDKLNHFFSFFLWVILLRYSFKTGYWAMFFYSLGFALFIEAIQYPLPYRTAEYGDIVADLFGALCGMFLYFFTEFGLKILQKEKDENTLN